MEKIRGFITNLGKYNEGELNGKWIEFPIDENELQDVLKEIGCYYVDENGMEQNIEYEEYFFTDWESEIPFGFGEYPDLEEVNKLAECVEALSEQEQEYLKLIVEDYTNDFQEAFDIVESGDYVLWDNCNDMSDVAYYYTKETGMLQDVPDSIAKYFDYASLGRDMDIEGTFLEGDGYYLEIIN